MKLYLESARDAEKLLRTETEKYELGKKYLAKMMGQDPETFGPDEVDKAINYLLPSGLTEKKARPMMKHPSYIMPQKLVAQFSLDGRPYHYLFYTGKPKLYEVLHTMAVKLENLVEIDKETHFKAMIPEIIPKFNFEKSEWKSQAALSEMINQKISEEEYDQFVTLGNALVQHVLAHKEKDFLMQYRDKVEVVKFRQDKSELMQEEGGRIFVAEKGSKKTSKARVKLYSVGTGKITINGDSILYFKDMPYREQVIFPLQFTGMLGCVDIVAKVEGGGLASQALALRLAISKCLANFVNDDMLFRMTVAGLLMKDPRKRERKKPGQKGARAKYTWRPR